MLDTRKHVETAISLYGSQAKLAEKVGCSQQYISWLLSEPSRRISAEMALAFERATDGKLSKHEMRPDIFGAAS